MDLTLVGVLLSIFVSGVKRLYKNATGKDMPGALAIWLTAGLSLATGAAISLWNGTIPPTPQDDPMAFLKWLGETYAIVLGTATTFYNLVLSKERGLRALGG
jgi:drug/metabolite transporter (DMT)-like permease